MGSERRREQLLREALKAVEYYENWMRNSLDKYAETGDGGHLSGATNGLVLMGESVTQILDDIRALREEVSTT